MIHPRTLSILACLIAAAVFLIGAAAGETPAADPPPGGPAPEGDVTAGSTPAGAECATALEVIEKNLEAVGGRERIRGIQTLKFSGAGGSALLPPSEKATVYLQKPDRFKQVGAFRIILCDGERYLMNDGVELSELKGGNLEGMRYRLGFYHNAFSLLNWEPFFPTAELLGVKRYGPVRHYEIRLPGAEGGRDLLVYVDTKTFLVDRLIFVITQEGAGTLEVVNQLRDWKNFGGVLMPTRLVYDKIGWETTPTHFVISEMEINPELEEGLFDSAEIDFGRVVTGEGRVQGEIFGDMDGSLLTNIRAEDLHAAGIEEKSWLYLEVGGTRLTVRYLGNIQRSAADIKPDEIYITTYPICGFPRMMLMGWDIDVTERIPCVKGDAMTVTRIEP